MLDSLKLYRASPEAFFSGLDSKLKEIEEQIASLRSQVASISELADAFVRRLPLNSPDDPPPSKWTYRAESPNLYFDDVFEPELKGKFIRWVGTSGRLHWTLRLPRHFQYDFSIHCVDFLSESMRESFRLKVGDETYPWISKKDDIFRTIILESSDENELVLDVSVDPQTANAGSDVTFSFSYIEVSRCG